MNIPRNIRIRSIVKPYWVPHGTFSQNDIKNEPMLFNCSLASAEWLGGPITGYALSKLPKTWIGNRSECVVDTRVHMLMPGWYPCIPGWHTDDVPRKGKYNQPDYVTPEYKAEHVMMIVGGAATGCKTEFACGDLSLPNRKTRLYAKWNDLINQKLEAGQLDIRTAEDYLWCWFDWQTLHRGVPATKAGWRYFIRVSKRTDRCRTVTNEVRKQVQVYLPIPEEGW